MEGSEKNAEKNENVGKETLHHKKQELCMTRPAYRQGRKFTAVKVYSVSSESQHLFVYGVPSINLRNELKSLFNKYGEIITFHVVPQQKVEMFTECYHVHYRRIQSARIAKRLVDTKSFYGGVLHVCYAPEYETLEETTSKLLQRKKDVLVRLNKYDAELFTNHSEINAVNKDEHTRKSNLFENDVAPIYSESDPILSHKKKQKKNAEENIAKYTSQCSDVNGGLCNGLNMNNSLKKHSKKLVPLPLRYKNISSNQVYGPQLPKSTINSTRNEEISGESLSNANEKIVETLEGNGQVSSQKIIRKVPNNVEKRIIFRNKIQDKMS